MPGRATPRPPAWQVPHNSGALALLTSHRAARVEEGAMMAAQPQTPAARPVDSLEVRWMVPGRLESGENPVRRHHQNRR